MDQNNIIECAGFYFIHNFDSGNLGHVERVPTELIAPSANSRTNATETPDYEFNLWTRPDCAGTEFENGNRTWFYFGIQASEPGVLVRLNIINLNKQGKMYNQGMAPVTRTLPGKPQWERIRDKPVHFTDDNTFTLSFKYRTSENVKATSFFAFTYPYSYAELQMALNCIDMKMLPMPSAPEPDDIYYYRECLVYSLEGRRVDLLTISSHHGISTEKEERLKNLFPENLDRPCKFLNKKVIFISARVHPGETPSSFVFNGFLNLLLTKNDPIAIQLRKLYVFKMIPFLNPDGVARGHYRTDTRGVNLNRVYLNPSYLYHPTVYASRALIRYYHYGCEKEDIYDDSKSFISRSIQNDTPNCDFVDIKKKKPTLQALSRSKETNKRDLPAKVSSDKSNTNTKKEPYNGLVCVNTVNTGDHIIGEVAGQVNEMRLQEQDSQTTDIGTDEGSLLNDNVIKSYLGSDVHLSTSEELRFEGKNPLKPLREALKDSISLLMGSSEKSSAAESSQLPPSSMVALGWCRECRKAIATLEDTMPGIAQTTISTTTPSTAQTCHSIEEYREQQRKQINDQQERKNQQEASKRGTVYFCTNCFKRYLVTDTNEEINMPEPSTESVSISAGNSREAGDSPLVNQIITPQSQSKTQIKLSKSAFKKKANKDNYQPPQLLSKIIPKEAESGLYLYIDLHGHASKKGIFMYGNHFEDLESSVECMLLPRIMSLNNLHFHFSSCNFTERNMYLKDRRDGMSREGSGRVAVLKATGLVRSYTLECNYNTGRLVNVLPPGVKDSSSSAPIAPPAPPKYTPNIYEEVGRSLGASILDLTCSHPNSRIPNSEHRNLATIRDWLRAHTRSMKAQIITTSRLRPHVTSPARPIYPRTSKSKTEDRKENSYRTEERPQQTRPDHKFSKRPEKTEPVKTTSRRYIPVETRNKSITTKRRNVLGVRKPNASKTQMPRNKSRRSTDESTESKVKSKRSLRRNPRVLASSSSEEVSWPADALKRRSFATPAPPMLKKIRLKTVL